MGMNLDNIGQSFDWQIQGNIFGQPFQWVAKLRVTSAERRTELQKLISEYSHLLQSDPASPRLEGMGTRAVARELLLGWHDPNGEIIYRGQALADTPENIELVLKDFPGVDVAVCLGWFEAANGEKARLGNSESSRGFGAEIRRATPTPART